MRFEHNQTADLLGKIAAATELDSVRVLAKQMIQATRGHFQKEEQILFRMARQFLSEDELASFGAQWAQKRTIVGAS